MSAYRRKPRPLRRAVGQPRDTRLFIVACDDTYAPKQYFDFFEIARVQVHVVPTEDGTSAAPYVLTRLLAFEHEGNDERWMLLDTDHCTGGSHYGTYVATLDAARQRGVNVCLSKPSFEFWLLLHHVDEAVLSSLSLKNAAEIEAALREVLGRYNKTRLERDHFLLQSVRQACERAAKLDATVKDNYRPEVNTSRVYKLWQAIAASSPRAQLPEELRGLGR